jgi:membrane protein DedA with SNARE-associated domain
MNAQLPIPIEIIHIIASYLNGKDIVNFGMVIIVLSNSKIFSQIEKHVIVC